MTNWRKRVADWTLLFQQLPRSFRLVWDAWPAAAAVVPVLSLAMGPLPALRLYFLKRIIDGVTLWAGSDPAEGRHMTLLFVGLHFGSLMLERSLMRLHEFLEQAFAQRLVYHVRHRIMAKVAELDAPFFDTPAFFDRLQRAQREAGMRPFNQLYGMLASLRELFVLAGYVLVLASLSWWAMPYLVLLVLPTFVVLASFGQLGWMMMFGFASEERRLYYYENTVSSPQTQNEVRLFGLWPHFGSLWRDAVRRWFVEYRRHYGRLNLAMAAADAAQIVGSLGFFAFAIYRTVNDPLVTIGSLVMYIQAMDAALNSIRNLFQSAGGLYESNLYMRNLFEFLDLRPQIARPAIPARVPNPMREGIRFENVRFRYPTGTRDVLEDISFAIAPGERIAIVGENGAGKTTLVKLLARLYDPAGGRITVDGIDLRDLDPADWHRQIGIIFQDYARYAVTLRDNIGFGQVDRLSDEARIHAAAAMSGADGCVERLEKGWETVLGKMFDDGQDLSVGEWQKVALARAFMREAQILVLDEPTASLDAKQEYETFLRFDELTRGKTTILISHRFSTVRMADRIVVIEGGRIVESGSHAELMAQDGGYAELFNRQAAPYR